MLVIKTDCCCSDSVKYSQKLKFLICCLSFLQDPAYDVIYRTHKPFWSHNCNNWLVHLLILRSKSLPLTFMVIFLSCLVFLQQPGGRHHPTKKMKKERAPAAGRCVGTSVYMQTSPFTQFNHTATPAVVSDGGISLQWRSIGLHAGIFHRCIPPPGCPEALSAAALSSVEQLESRWPARCL